MIKPIVLTQEEAVIKLAAIYTKVWDVSEFRWKASEYLLSHKDMALFDDMAELEFLLRLDRRPREAE